MRSLLSIVPFAALLAFSPAQDQATTLSSLTADAAVIVIATVTAATDPSPDWHRLEWTTDEVLRGQIGAQFALLEPAGACCGRSLFALGIGEQRLLFLRRTGPAVHPLGGSRGVVAATPSVLLHVRALLAATTTAQLAHLLADSLDHGEPRVAHDAAHSLAQMSDLPLSAEDRTRALIALDLAVQRGATSAASLITVIARCADSAMLDAVLPMYLQQSHADRARMLRSGLASVAPELLTERLPAHLRGDPTAELRAAELLGQMPGQHSEAAQHQLLGRTRCPRVKLCLAENLLATGISANSLRPSVPSVILELAERRASEARFRFIEPRSR